MTMGHGDTNAAQNSGPGIRKPLTREITIPSHRMDLPKKSQVLQDFQTLHIASMEDHIHRGKQIIYLGMHPTMGV